MTDWQEQWQAGVDRWLEVQRDWWTTIMHTMNGPAPEQPDREVLEDLQHRIVEAWRQAAHQVAVAQGELLRRALADPPRTRVDDFVRRWTNAQRDMLRSLMAVASGGAEADAPDPSRAGGQVIESLQDAAERLVRSQADWARAWSAAHDGGVKDRTEPTGG